MKGSDGSIYNGYVRIIGGGASLRLVHAASNKAEKQPMDGIGSNYDLGSIFVGKQYSMTKEKKKNEKKKNENNDNNYENNDEHNEKDENEVEEQKKEARGISVRNVGNMPTKFKWKITDIYSGQDSEKEYTKKIVVDGKVQIEKFYKRTILDEKKNIEINLFENNNTQLEGSDVVVRPGMDLFLPFQLLIHDTSINHFRFSLEKDVGSTNEQGLYDLDVNPTEEAGKYLSEGASIA